MVLRRVAPAAALGLFLLVPNPALAQNPGQWSPPPGGPPPGQNTWQTQGQWQPQGPYQQAPPPSPAPYAYSPPPPPPPHWNEEDDEWDGGVGGWGLFGLRGSYLTVDGTDDDGSSGGLGIAAGMDGAFTGDILSFRGLSFAALGGSSEALEGFTEGFLSFGLRGYIGEYHGPFARLGYGWTALGNDKLFLWYIELPDVQIGYQFFTDDVVIDLGARGGVMLGGGYDVGGDAERDFKTSLAWGGVGMVAVLPVSLSGEILRVEARQTEPETPVGIVNGRLCIGYAFAGCADAKYIEGDVSLPGGGTSNATSLYLGLSLGIGIAGAIGD